MGWNKEWTEEKRDSRRKQIAGMTGRVKQRRVRRRRRNSVAAIEESGGLMSERKREREKGGGRWGWGYIVPAGTCHCVVSGHCHTTLTSSSLSLNTHEHSTHYRTVPGVGLSLHLAFPNSCQYSNGDIYGYLYPVPSSWIHRGYKTAISLKNMKVFFVRVAYNESGERRR